MCARACDDSVRRVLFTVLEEGVCLAGLWRNLMTLTATLAIFVMALGRLSQSSTRVLCFRASWFGSACCHVWGRRGSYTVSVGNLSRIGRPRRRWEDDINVGVKEMSWKGVDWVDVVSDRDNWRAVVKTVMNIQIP